MSNLSGVGVFLNALLFVFFANASTWAQPGLYEQRGVYRRALDDLNAGRSRSFASALVELEGYALHPYLDYHRLQSRLSVASEQEVQTFRKLHENLPVTAILHRRWLKILGRKRQWRTFLNNYEPSSDAELQCYRLRALYGTGEREAAFAEVEPLWKVAKSQPKACDPLFDVWISAGHLEEDIAWQRLELALKSNQRTLARYLLRYFSGTYKAWAQSLYNVHVRPTRIARVDRYKTDSELSRTVIAHGLIRLAAQDVADAATAWEKFRATHSFNDAQTHAVRDAILIARAEDGQFPVEQPSDASVELIAGMTHAALASQSWRQAVTWINHLRPEDKQSNRWQYWQARALTETHLDISGARQIYRALAETREYYGFLAAERIGSEIQLNEMVLQAHPAQITQLKKIPEVARSIELYAVGDLINARREWNQLIPKLDPTRKLQVARLVQQIGWTSQSIAIANNANLRDDLAIRFPLAYQNVVEHISHTTTVPQSLLFAIIRQESAFDPRARSRANARGLMQLISSTAKEVARRARLKSPGASDLYIPEINIELGGHHLAELLTRYDGQRPLVAAAYNAGRSRVDRWIKNRSGMPMDVWIETIPIRETRNYVKNVLSFAQVYGQRMGNPVPMLQANEAALP
ncbi:MAG: transglycosylase SLT domain-containing protein [Gammaproteobacteria bacterium]|nr:transglycosylase SLT domain-containing protein [Gammaproteobacteria bacterium]